jgi:hypothetical protein
VFYGSPNSWDKERHWRAWGFGLYVLLFVGKAVAIASALAAHTLLCLAHLAVLMCEMRTAFLSECTRSKRRSWCPTRHVMMCLLGIGLAHSAWHKASSLCAGLESLCLQFLLQRVLHASSHCLVLCRPALVMLVHTLALVIMHAGTCPHDPVKLGPSLERLLLCLLVVLGHILPRGVTVGMGGRA